MFHCSSATFLSLGPDLCVCVRRNSRGFSCIFVSPASSSTPKSPLGSLGASGNIAIPSPRARAQLFGFIVAVCAQMLPAMCLRRKLDQSG